MENLRKSGFTLLELITALFIISTLTLLSTTLGVNHLKQLHCREGELALLDLAARMEHYFTKHQTYETATLGLGKMTDVKSNKLSSKGHYWMSIEEQSLKNYILKATPLSPNQPALTLNNFGEKEGSCG